LMIQAVKIITRTGRAAAARLAAALTRCKVKSARCAGRTPQRGVPTKHSKARASARVFFLEIQRFD
jgi:hypothetical protein